MIYPTSYHLRSPKFTSLPFTPPVVTLTRHPYQTRCPDAVAPAPGAAVVAKGEALGTPGAWITQPQRLGDVVSSRGAVDGGKWCFLMSG